MPENNVGGVEIELRRDLGFFDVTMIGVGAMIGAGIFVLTGYAINGAGPGAIIVFLLNGIVAVLTALTYMELGSCFPEAGGGYLWVREGMPHPFGFLSGWMSWMAHTIACTLYALGFGSYLAWAFKPGGEDFSLALMGIDYAITYTTVAKLFAVIVAVILLGINFMGTGTTGKTENIVTVAKLITLFIFIGFGIFAMINNPHAVDNFSKNFLPKGFGGIAYGMGLTFIAFQGFEVIAQCGEEVKEPRKNIPKAIIVSMVVVVIIYIAIAIVAIGGVNTGDGESWRFYGELDNPELAMVAASESFMEPVGLGWLGVLIMIVGGLVSTVSALNATVFSSSRVSFAMGRDGTLPSALGTIHPTRRTPSMAIFITGIILIIMAISLPIEDVAASADVMFLLLFSFANISLITLRRKMPYLKRGFVVPLVPFIPLLATGLNIALAIYLFQHSPVSWYIAILWIEIGLIGYYFTRGKKEISDLEKVEKLIGVPRRETGKKYHVLVPIANPNNTELIDIASTVAKHRDGDMILLNIAAIPDTIPIQNVDYEFVKRRVGIAEQLSDYTKSKHNVLTRARVVVSHKIRDTILEVVNKEKANFTIIGWTGKAPRGRIVFGYNIDDIIQFAKSDVAILRGPTKGKIDRIMLFPGFKHHGAKASELAAFIAKDFNATVAIVGLLTPNRTETEVKTESGYFAEIIRRHGVPVEEKTIRTKRPIAKLISMAKEYDMILVGADEKWKLLRYAFGPVQDLFASKTDKPIIMIRAYEKEEEMISTSEMGEDEEEGPLGVPGPPEAVEEEVPEESTEETMTEAYDDGNEPVEPAEGLTEGVEETISDDTQVSVQPVPAVTPEPAVTPTPVPVEKTKPIPVPTPVPVVEGPSVPESAEESISEVRPAEEEGEEKVQEPAVKAPKKLPIIPEEMEDEEESSQEGNTESEAEDAGQGEDGKVDSETADEEDSTADRGDDDA